MSTIPTRLRELRQRFPPGRLALAAAWLVAPALVVWAELFYCQALYHWLYLGTASFGYWLALLALPPLVGEVAFTRAYEVGRYGWRPWVIAALVWRLLFALLVFWLLVWMPMREKGSLGIVHPQIGFWPWVARLVWVASPYLGGLLAVGLGALYAVGCRFRLGRWVTGVALPAGATLLLFNVLYFHPTSAWRFSNGERPSYVEKIYPTGRLSAVPPGMPYPFQARDIYVYPDDRYMILLSGATFGDRVHFQPNFLWVDLLSGEIIYYMMGQNRRFSVECPQQVWFAPWKTNNLYVFELATRRIRAVALPSRVGGYGVREIMHTVNACKLGRVYVANNNNPVVFVWDTRLHGVIKILELAKLPGGRLGDTIVQLLRNPRLGVLYVVMIGPGMNLVEIDEQTLSVRRTVRLPYHPFDVALSPDGLTLFSQAIFRGYVTRIDARTMRVERSFNAPVHGRRVLVSHDGRWLYLASYLHGTLEVLDARTGRRRLRVFVTPKIEGLFLSERHLWFYGAEGVFRISLAELARRL